MAAGRVDELSLPDNDQAARRLPSGSLLGRSLSWSGPTGRSLGRLSWDESLARRRSLGSRACII
jgi:hypothetical protein